MAHCLHLNLKVLVQSKNKLKYFSTENSLYKLLTRIQFAELQMPFSLDVTLTMSVCFFKLQQQKHITGILKVVYTIEMLQKSNLGQQFCNTVLVSLTLVCTKAASVKVYKRQNSNAGILHHKDIILVQFLF